MTRFLFNQANDFNHEPSEKHESNSQIAPSHLAVEEGFVDL